MCLRVEEAFQLLASCFLLEELLFPMGVRAVFWAGPFLVKGTVWRIRDCLALTPACWVPANPSAFPKASQLVGHLVMIEKKAPIEVTLLYPALSPLQGGEQWRLSLENLSGRSWARPLVCPPAWPAWCIPVSSLLSREPHGRPEVVQRGFLQGQ